MRSTYWVNVFLLSVAPPSLCLTAPDDSAFPGKRGKWGLKLFKLFKASVQIVMRIDFELPIAISPEFYGSLKLFRILVLAVLDSIDRESLMTLRSLPRSSQKIHISSRNLCRTDTSLILR